MSKSSRDTVKMNSEQNKDARDMPSNSESNAEKMVQRLLITCSTCTTCSEEILETFFNAWKGCDYCQTRVLNKMEKPSGDKSPSK